MKINQELLNNKIHEFDKYKPFPEKIKISNCKTIVNIEIFLVIHCLEYLKGNQLAIKRLKLFEDEICKQKNF